VLCTPPSAKFATSRRHCVSALAGWGRHSAGGVAKVKPEVQRMFREDFGVPLEIAEEAKNDGKLTVTAGR
jgi:hypothetical protein